MRRPEVNLCSLSQLLSILFTEAGSQASLDDQLAPGLSFQVLEIQIGCHSHPAFTWVPGIRIHVLMLAQHVF